jgi:hypothetical protein
MFSPLRLRCSEIDKALDLNTELHKAFMPSVGQRIPPTRWNLKSLELESEQLSTFARHAFDPSLVFAAFPIPGPTSDLSPPKPGIDRPHRLTSLPREEMPHPQKSLFPDFDFPFEDLVALSRLGRRSSPPQSPTRPRPKSKSKPKPKLKPRFESNPPICDIDDDLDRFIDEIDTMGRW